jgi:hypothetical protein
MTYLRLDFVVPGLFSLRFVHLAIDAMSITTCTFLDGYIVQLDAYAVSTNRAEVVNIDSDLLTLLNNIKSKLVLHSKQLIYDSMAHAYVVGWCFSLLEKALAKTWTKKMLRSVTAEHR